MQGNRQVIQVVPRLLPTRCGVSDHAIALASALKVEYRIDTSFVILNSDESTEVAFDSVYCRPDELLSACVTLSKGEPAPILVHVSGYGYSADGAPRLLAKALEKVKADGRFRIAIFFHELFATGMPWRSAFWYSHRQKKAVRRIAKICDLALTNTRTHAEWLSRETERTTSTPIQCLPVFSLVGEAQRPIPPAARDPVMAVFGLGKTRQNAYRELTTLSSMLRQLGIREILDIGPEKVLDNGPEIAVPGEVEGIPVRRMGVLTAEQVAHEFSRSTFGYLSYSPACLAKSGVFAGYCAHGVIPVLGRHFAGQIAGLEDGVNLLSPRTVRAAQARGLESCSIAAWEWYSGHPLRDHAAVYARWMGVVGAAPKRADGNHK